MIMHSTHNNRSRTHTHTHSPPLANRNQELLRW